MTSPPKTLQRNKISQLLYLLLFNVVVWMQKMVKRMVKILDAVGRHIFTSLNLDVGRTRMSSCALLVSEIASRDHD